MSLADRIIDERKKAHWSQEELAHRLNVSRQAVSKWESEQAVPDLERVVQMADLFGTTTDFLLKGEEAGEQGTTAAKPARFVSEEDAHDFLSYRQKSVPVVALGVALCVLSPALLIFLDGLAEDSVFGITNELAIAIGLPAMIICIGIAAYLFVSQGAKGEKYQYLEHEKILVADAALEEASSRCTTQAEAFGRNMATGIALCVVACVPLIIVSCFIHTASVICAFIALLLLIVAAGVYVIVRTAGTRDSYDMLLQINDYAPGEKTIRQKLNFLSGIFWSSITLIYLVVSFLTGKWGATWVIWPVAGVLFGIANPIAKRIMDK